MCHVGTQFPREGICQSRFRSEFPRQHVTHLFVNFWFCMCKQSDSPRIFGYILGKTRRMRHFHTPNPEPTRPVRSPFRIRRPRSRTTPTTFHNYITEPDECRRCHRPRVPPQGRHLPPRRGHRGSGRVPRGSRAPRSWPAPQRLRGEDDPPGACVHSLRSLSFPILHPNAPKVGRTTLGLSLSDRHLTRLFSFLIFQQHGVEFGHGILNKGGAKKREKRPLTQIEIMAALEREKTQKKAARKAAKVREPPTFPGPTRSPDRRDPHKKKIISSIDQFSDPRRTHAAYSPTDAACSPNPPSTTTTGGQEGGAPRQGGVRPDRRKQETDQEGTQEARTR